MTHWISGLAHETAQSGNATAAKGGKASCRRRVPTGAGGDDEANRATSSRFSTTAAVSWIQEQTLSASLLLLNTQNCVLMSSPTEGRNTVASPKVPNPTSRRSGQPRRADPRHGRGCSHGASGRGLGPPRTDIWSVLCVTTCTSDTNRSHYR